MENNFNLNFRYDSRYDSEYKRRIQEVVEYILDKEYGSTITFEILGRMLHYNLEDDKQKQQFRSTMGRIKKFLIQKGYVLKSIGGVGYYILKPKQISGFCYHTYIRRTENLLDKSAEILKHTDISELSKDRKEEYDNVCNLNMNLTNDIQEVIESSKYYNRKTYYDSLED